MSNAIRHNGKKDKWVRATVADSADGRSWEVAVEDNGDGIDAEARRRIYDRYARFSKKTGYGLGMSIVKSLVAVMGGAIRIEDRVPDEPAQGTRFVVALPKG
jgi:signal transduction histidine kinase